LNYFNFDKAKPVVRQGRKAAGLREDSRVASERKRWIKWTRL